MAYRIRSFICSYIKNGPNFRRASPGTAAYHIQLQQPILGAPKLASLVKTDAGPHPTDQHGILHAVALLSEPDPRRRGLGVDLDRPRLRLSFPISLIATRSIAMIARTLLSSATNRSYASICRIRRLFSFGVTHSRLDALLSPRSRFRWSTWVRFVGSSFSQKQKATARCLYMYLRPSFVPCSNFLYPKPLSYPFKIRPCLFLT